MKFEDLEVLLRDWSSMAGPETYDFVGMVHLFRACLENLRGHATDADWDEVTEVFTDEERAFLEGLVRRLAARAPDAR